MKLQIAFTKSKCSLRLLHCASCHAQTATGRSDMAAIVYQVDRLKTADLP